MRTAGGCSAAALEDRRRPRPCAHPRRRPNRSGGRARRTSATRKFAQRLIGENAPHHPLQLLDRGSGSATRPRRGGPPAERRRCRRRCRGTPTPSLRARRGRTARRWREPRRRRRFGRADGARRRRSSRGRSRAPSGRARGPACAAPPRGFPTRRRGSGCRPAPARSALGDRLERDLEPLLVYEATDQQDEALVRAANSPRRRASSSSPAAGRSSGSIPFGITTIRDSSTEKMSATCSRM